MRSAASSGLYVLVYKRRGTPDQLQAAPGKGDGRPSTRRTPPGTEPALTSAARAGESVRSRAYEEALSRRRRQGSSLTRAQGFYLPHRRPARPSRPASASRSPGRPAALPGPPTRPRVLRAAARISTSLARGSTPGLATCTGDWRGRASGGLLASPAPAPRSPPSGLPPRGAQGRGGRGGGPACGT